LPTGYSLEEKKIAYTTDFGLMYQGFAEDFFRSDVAAGIQGTVNLIFTSPPYPLNRKKRYGNLQGEEYLRWLSDFALEFRRALAPDGSLVLELGNAWEPGSPTMSTLALRSLLALQEAGDFRLCQEVIAYNPARLPSPAQWVNVERIRLKDSFTRLWWLSTSDRPKADNRKVLVSYSTSMRQLLKTQKYNAGPRPSEHHIGQTSFFTDNGGAIAPNVLKVANTRARDSYLEYCRTHGLPIHPARMPSKLAEFFISFLTDPGDLVLDPFSGSNTTGASAEGLQRRWVTVEPNESYIKGSVSRFSALSYVRPDLVCPREEQAQEIEGK